MASRLMVVLVACGVALALGLVAPAWVLVPGSSQAQQGIMRNCPPPGKWAISVWDGPDDTDTGQALATCGAVPVAAAYHRDPQTQSWSCWFAGRPKMTTLATLDSMQGVIALGDAAAPATTELLRIVDKEHGLPASYMPPNLVQIPAEWWAPGFPNQLLRKEAANALGEMLQAARAQGQELRVASSYRSYEEQAATFQYWVGQLGEEQARRLSAPPGHSEHQLGSTVDLTSASVDWQLIQAFGQTPEGQWLAAHAHEFGFALSYPQGAEAITGYKYEPWHFRYIGRIYAEQWSQSGLTLIEFLKQLSSQS